MNSSHFEGFPNSIVEAINYNLPVFSSRSGGGVQEILLNGKAGTFFNSEDYLELARKIVQRTSTTMKLEDQVNSKERIEKAIKERAAEIINKTPKILWD